MRPTSLYYHNDNPFAVSDTVNVEIELAGKTYKVLTWNVGELSANSNIQGSTVNFILPSEEGTKEFNVRLSTESKNADNSYRLLYRCSERPKTIRELNT